MLNFRHGHLFIVAILLVAVASSVLLAATLSVPIFKTSSIFRLRADVDGLDRFVDFGIWGYCIIPVGKENNKNPISPLPDCTKSGLGWIFGADVVQTLQASQDLPGTLTKIQTSMLVLYPITTAITIINFILSIATCAARRPTTWGPMQLSWRPRHLRNIFLLDCLNTFLIIFTLIVHIELVTGLRTRVRGSQNGNVTLRVLWGDALWFCVSALVCLFCHSFIVRRIRIANRNAEFQISRTPSSTQHAARKSARETSTREHEAHLSWGLPVAELARQRTDGMAFEKSVPGPSRYPAKELQNSSTANSPVGNSNSGTAPATYVRDGYS